MTSAPLEPSHDDPNLRPDLAPDGSPTPTPGLDVERPEDVPSDPGDPTDPGPEES